MKNYGLLTLLFFFSRFRCAKKALKPWLADYSGLTTITIFGTLAGDKHEYCQQADYYYYGLFTHFYFRSLRKFTNFFLISLRN